MNRSFPFAIFICATIVFSACAEVDTTVKETPENIITDEEPQLPIEATVVQDKLELNEGEKWLVNAETTEAVANMSKHCEEFEGTNHVELGNLLMFQTTNIIDNCNMKGNGHVQLHVWLLPLIDAINQLQSEQSTDHENISELLSVFASFFEGEVAI